jgi:hypothetical protein
VVTTVLLTLLVLAIAAVMCRTVIRSVRWIREDIWAISIYVGSSPLTLQERSGPLGGPVVTARSVTDVRARFVADPFLVFQQDTWWMFLEVMDRRTRRGVIAVAKSSNGFEWAYERRVLEEPFHLSYPYVFNWNGQYYMLPESGEARSVRLYHATDFPYKWRLDRQLLTGDYLDPSIFEWDSRWWMFAQRDRRDLTLHFSTTPLGPWVEHPASPVVVGDVTQSRPAGRVTILNGKPIRLAQDCRSTYGRSVRAFRIDELTETAFQETELAPDPILGASGQGWNKDGMHHVDAQQTGPASWIAAVDGKRIRSRLNVRRTLRAIFGGH